MNELCRYDIPAHIKNISIDVGLSYNAPQCSMWLQNDPSAYVFGFEPNIESVECLRAGNIIKRETYHSDPISNANLERLCIIPVALSDVPVPTTAKFYTLTKDCGTASLNTPIDHSLGKIKSEYTVPVYSLAHFFDYFPWDRFPFINYLKIDAQGSDLAILRGAGKYLSERVVYVTAEPEYSSYANCKDNTIDGISKYMRSQNFTKIKHPKTTDPTFINKKYTHLKDLVRISQI